MKKFKFFLVFLIIISALGVYLPNSTSADVNKNYRAGEFFNIQNKEYLAVNNSSFIEILEVTNNKLIKINEIYLDNVNDIYLDQANNKIGLLVLTGRYLIRYDVSNPSLPKIEAKRDLYAWRGKGKNKIGYMKSLAGNSKYIFTAGLRGVRTFDINFLAVADNKTFTLEQSYGIIANDNILVALIKDKGFYDKGLVFDIETGNLVNEYSLNNIDNTEREPTIDNLNNIYFLSDNSLMKFNTAGEVVNNYYNPVASGLVFSYSALALDNEIFYVNGFGLTKLDSDLRKKEFFFSAPSNIYGPNSWAVGVATNNSNKVAILNKSSVLLLDKDLNLLDQYKYEPLFSETLVRDLKIEPSKYFAVSGEALPVRLYGFWPNEDVSITLGSLEEKARVDSFGTGTAFLNVPEDEATRTVISATGEDSGLNYQVSFNIR